VSTEENKALVRRYLDEAVNKGNLDVLDEVMDPNYVNPTIAIGRTPGGRERYKGGVSRERAAFPDLQIRLESVIAEGDLVAYHSVWSGTHLGEWRGIPPTGKRVEWRATCYRRVKDGKLVEGWGTYDWLGVLEQLGASVTPPKVD
jgi:steroid delta-isomerase-like uncharacterized protein